MWHLDDELEQWFEWVREDQAPSGGGDRDDDDEDGYRPTSRRREGQQQQKQNDFAVGRGRDS